MRINFNEQILILDEKALLLWQGMALAFKCSPLPIQESALHLA